MPYLRSHWLTPTLSVHLPLTASLATSHVLLAQSLAHHDTVGPLSSDGFPCEFATWYEFTGIVSTQYNGITMDAYLQQDHHGILSNSNGILSAMESR